jgi:DNA-directed RNA polymerase specialized sigma24 family protein
LLLYNRNRLKYILRQTQLEKQNQLAESEAELARKNILYAQNQLAEVVNHISEKNKLIEGLENRLAENEKIDIQEVLRNFTIITGNDWLKFKDYFEKAYPNYWERLNQKLPKLTQSDERLLTLLKLQLGNKEIAAATGISAESVRVSIHRLRKKVEAIYPDISLEEFIATI